MITQIIEICLINKVVILTFLSLKKSIYDLLFRVFKCVGFYNSQEVFLSKTLSPLSG